MNYEQDIRIDETALDVEWLEQPSLLLRYAKHVAGCRKTLDEIKEELDLIKAEIDRKIRKNPEKYDIEKITEGVIQATILRQSKFKEVNETYIQSKYELDVAQAALNAVYQRKDALENMVKLYGMQYFAGPKVPRILTDERKLRQENADEKIANKMKKRNPRYV
jgi:hypothetical protein